MCQGDLERYHLDAPFVFIGASHRMSCQKGFCSSLLLGLCLAASLFCGMSVNGQESRDRWDSPLNLSNTEGNSIHPFVLADKSGIVHAFWSDDLVGGQPGNMAFAGAGKELMYAAWDGEYWSQPVDILLSPQNGPASQAQAVIDEQGIIHLVWMGEWPPVLYYSRAHAGEAGTAQAWETPVALASDLTGSQFCVALAYEEPQILHVIYARVFREGQPSEPRAVSYVRSTDAGSTWSQPTDLCTIPEPDRGASMVNLLVVNPGQVYASWTEWDGTGNGQAIYLARSLDSGATWEEPVLMAAREPDEYEHDWLSLTMLGENQLAAIWEGGGRAYRQARYSRDGGTSWSAPGRILPDLIGENGFAEFAYDSAGRLHLFVAQRGAGPRIRSTMIGLWHSVWDGADWSEPELIGGVNPMVYPKVAIVGGNRVVAAWYNDTVGEIMVLTGEIGDAPSLAPQPWSTATPTPTATPSPIALPATATAVPTRSTLAAASVPPSSHVSPNPGIGVLVGVVPSFFVVAAVVLIQRLRSRL